jgi:hypothetical protein
MSAFVNNKPSPSAKIRAGLAYPVIDSDVHSFGSESDDRTESSAGFFKGTAVEAKLKRGGSVSVAAE